MKYITLPNTDLHVSSLCLGGGNFGTAVSETQAFEILDAFLEAGGNIVDTANVYCRWVEGLGNCSERIIGKWLKSRNAYNKLTVATKGGHYDMKAPHISRVNKKDVCADIEESINTLGIDCLDLYWLHRDNEEIPIEEIVEFMESFVKSGKIKYYGASNYRLARMERAAIFAAKNRYTGFCAVSNQWSLASENKDNPLNNDPSMVSADDEFLAWHKKTKTPLFPYSSTACGFFEKLYRSNPQVKDGILLSDIDDIDIWDGLKKAFINENNLRTYEKLLELKEIHAVSLYTLSAAYLTSFNEFDVIPISSVRNTEQLNEFIKASEIAI